MVEAERWPIGLDVLRHRATRLLRIDSVTD